VDLLRPVKRFDAYQQRHRALAIPMAVVKKFGNDQAGNQAALVAYYAFFSLFPLLLVFVTVLGYALQGNASAMRSVETSVSKNFPGLGKVVDFTALHGHVLALVIGLATALWSGLSVTNAAQNAFDTVWAVPYKARPNYLKSRLRGLMLLCSLGALFILATGASGLVSGGFGGPLTKVLGIVVSLAVNVVLYFAAFRLMTAQTIETRRLWPGVFVAAVLWTVLQVVGGLYIGHVTRHLSPAYATVGTVIALLIWLHLGAQMTLYAAEINVVLDRELYPRSLMGPPVVPADQDTLTALAKVEERSEAQTVEVSFDVDGHDAGEAAAADAGDAGGTPASTPASAPASAPAPDTSA
jgi:membrane protein